MKKSAEKELRKAKKRTLRNKAIKAEIKYLERKLKKVIKEKNKKSAKDIFKKLQKKIDKAVKVGVFKKNKGSRKKSKLAKKINQL